jgi:hypothetical protein
MGSGKFRKNALSRQARQVPQRTQIPQSTPRNLKTRSTFLEAQGFWWSKSGQRAGQNMTCSRCVQSVRNVNRPRVAGGERRHRQDHDRGRRPHNANRNHREPESFGFGPVPESASTASSRPKGSSSTGRRTSSPHCLLDFNFMKCHSTGAVARSASCHTTKPSLVYVVSYDYDRSTEQGFVYLPGRGGELFKFNNARLGTAWRGTGFVRRPRGRTS